MSEKVKILGIDPSLRNTGLALLNFNTETKKISVTDCQVLVNPQKYKGKDAILNMLEMMQNSLDENVHYNDCDAYLVESPPVMFNKNWALGTISLISHVAGGAIVVFGIERVHIFRPNEWNKSRKKEVTHAATISEIGDPETWDFCETLKNDKLIEHVLDAASIALFWLKHQYWDED